MGVPRFRFKLIHQTPQGVIQLTNNSFTSTITGWNQVLVTGTSAITFTWDSIGAAKSSGAAANTYAIGQVSPFDSINGWHPGRYVIDITAVNASTGGSAPLQQALAVGASNAVSSFGTSISYLGTGTWDRGAGTITRRITFELTDYYDYLWFYFLKNGPEGGYNVNFTITQFNIITAPIAKSISEPDGWQKAVLKMERHPEFHSLVEYFEGSFIFYGSNGVDDGGIDFIKSVDLTYGYDAELRILIEVSFNDGGSYEEVFNGLLDLPDLEETKDNKIDVPIIPVSKWITFINRLDTPVDIRSLTDLDGNTILPVEPIDIDLPSQKIKKSFVGELGTGRSFCDEDIDLNDYIQIDFDKYTLDEITEKYDLPLSINPTVPQSLFDIGEDGEYVIDMRIEMSIKHLGGIGLPACVATYTTDPTSAYMDVYLDINGTQIALTKTDYIGQSTAYTYSGTHILKVGDAIGIYALLTSIAWKGTDEIDSILIWGTDNTLVNTCGGTFNFDGVKCVINTQFDTTRNFGTAPSGDTTPTTLSVVANTTYKQTEAKGFYIHDVAAGIIERILGYNIFYSEILGRTDTNMRTYASNGCYSLFTLLKGLQLRGYTLEEKPFFISFNQLWRIINPIFNLGLGYEIVNGEYVIRLEDKAHFYDKDNVSVYLENAREITRKYDNERIFKKIEIGYSKWESEDISGIDDPQTKHGYSTRAKGTGTVITLHSEGIAASLAIETTRRKIKEKTADYKYDNEVFIIHLNDDDVSPDRYRPALNEDFDSITGLLNSSTRYNTILTPLRSLLRWANYFNGCLQKYLTSSYKFVYGEGNYDMVSDYSCSGGYQCLAKICDALTESQDISLATYGPTLGFIHLPDLFTIDLNLSWEEYTAIRDNRKYAIAVSQTETNYKKELIKSISYTLCESKVKIESWAAEPFQMIVPESVQPVTDCS